MEPQKTSQQTEDIYSYTRGLRWKLQHTRGELPKPPEAAEEDADGLAQLVNLGMRLGGKLMFFIYMTEKGNPSKLLKDHLYKPQISHHVQINKKWLKQFFHSDFYAVKKKAAEFPLYEFRYAVAGLEQWIDRWMEMLKKIKDAYQTALHNKSRHSDIALLLYELKHKQNFPLIQGFAEHARHKTKPNLLPKLADTFAKRLDQELERYAPAQGAGLLIAAASLNYYTVGKKPKYSPEKQAELKSEYKRQQKKSESMKQNKAAQKSLLYELMAEGRIGGVENIQQREDLSLFHKHQDKDCLAEVYDLTREIQALTRDLNRACEEHGKGSQQAKDLRKDLRKAKQQRGFYFIKNAKGKNHSDYLKGWWKYCEDYKKIAMEMGRAKAELAGIKKERLEAEQLRYWALLRRKGEQTWLWCIPKAKSGEARDDLKKHRGKASDDAVYCFHSITHRALHKLCFAEGSSFAEDLPRDLSHLRSAAQKATNDPEELKKRRKKNPNAQAKDELELKFYKELLAHPSASNTLDLFFFNFDAALQARTLQEFQMAFDTAGYHAQKLPMDDAAAAEFTKRFGVTEFLLTSYDLERRHLKHTPTEPSAPRRHTDRWQQFWSEKQTKKPNIRLNPELKIRFRKADEELGSYIETVATGKIRHRRLQDQYTLHCTIELNGGRLHEETALAKGNEIAQKIDEFNQKFNERNRENSWKYGIDRGNIELATLCLARFGQTDTYEYKGERFLRPSFPEGEQEIKIYELKPEKYNAELKSVLETLPWEQRKEKRMLQNLSYFTDKLDDSEFFTQKNCTTIDLTTAKVIRGHIIANGDVLTFLKLKYEAAKRILFDLVAGGTIGKKNPNLEWGSEEPDKPEFVKLRYTDEHAKTDEEKENLTFYFFEMKPYGRNFEGVKQGNNAHGKPYTRENIRNALQKYVNDLLREHSEPSGLGNHHVPPIARINHLRDALVANMLGVICHLQQKYPGIVVLEDLKMNTIHEHFQEYNINISRRLEQALYRKFQTLGKVPPHLKGVVQLREKIHLGLEKKIEEEIAQWKAENPDARKNKTNKAEHKIRKRIKEAHKSLFTMQIGAIVYVDEENTSKNCPYCGKAMDWGSDEEAKETAKKVKFEQHRFSCGKTKSCGFDTDRLTGKPHEAPPLPPLSEPEPDFAPFREMDDPDKIAAYNVAKRAQNWKEIGSFEAALTMLNEQPEKRDKNR